MPEPSSPVPPALPPANPANPWVQAVIWLGVTLIVAGGTVLCFRACTKAPVEIVTQTAQLVEKTGEKLAEVAAAFNRGTVSTSFISYATGVSNHTYLQFATLKQMELFERSQAYSTAFGYVPLPEVVVEARAPVQYTYYLDLNESWRFVLESNRVHVFAPAIRYNQPAVDVSAMKLELRKGLLNYKHKEVEEQLRQTITGLVALRARENIPLVREQGRRQTEQYIERWLAQSFGDGQQYTVKVFFPGEPPPGQATILPQPRD